MGWVLIINLIINIQLWEKKYWQLVSNYVNIRLKLFNNLIFFEIVRIKSYTYEFVFKFLERQVFYRF